VARQIIHPCKLRRGFARFEFCQSFCRRVTRWQNSFVPYYGEISIVSSADFLYSLFKGFTTSDKKLAELHLVGLDACQPVGFVFCDGS
jgi:hypothetical protein